MLFGLLRNKVHVKEDAYSTLCEAAEYLQENPRAEFDPSADYDDRVMRALNTLDYDDDYMKNYEKIQRKPAEQLSLDEISTMYTFIVRGERFCDGHIAAYINDGTIFRLVQREIELLQNIKR